MFLLVSERCVSVEVLVRPDEVVTRGFFARPKLKIETWKMAEL